MSFRIKTLSIYSHEGDVRTIKFNPSGLSIITGRAKTGKSSVIDIIDYCLGRGSCWSEPLGSHVLSESPRFS